jgi:hypothetical protein
VLHTDLLRAYLEHVLAALYDLPREAVVVAPWTPGNGCLQCMLESSPARWDPDYKAQLSRSFAVRLRRALASTGMFETAAAQRRRARSLPVSHAVAVILRAWRWRKKNQQAIDKRCVAWRGIHGVRACVRR